MRGGTKDFSEIIGTLVVTFPNTDQNRCLCSVNSEHISMTISERRSEAFLQT